MPGHGKNPRSARQPLARRGMLPRLSIPTRKQNPTGFAQSRATTPAEKEEIQQIMQAVANNNPELFRELMLTEAPEYEIIKYGLDPSKHSYFNVSGPLVNRSIKRFGYKLICAL